MNYSHTRFTDEYFNVHTQDELLGQGGQGIVFRTKDPDIAIKLVTNIGGAPMADQEQIKRYSRRLKNIRLLPFPKGINLSVPAALLKNNAGYVMQLLSDMVPFSSFWLNGPTAGQIQELEIPGWMEEIPEKEAKKIVHYCKSGGLRRRLIALYKCANILARLHGNGLVYGDISPLNAYISDDHTRAEVWLIDADNLRFEIATGGSCVYTPQYGAPELVQGRDGGRPGTDCHAFAVMAYYMLTMVHPFIGDYVTNGVEVDWADESAENESLDEKAYRGEIPWIEDKKEDLNRLELGGLRGFLTITPELQILFQKTLGDGRTCAWKRPAMFHWPVALAKAADKTILCPSCRMSWYFDIGAETCPYCDSNKPLILFCQAYHWTGTKNLDSPSWVYVHEIPKSGISLIMPERLFKSFSMTGSDNSILEFQFTDHNLLISKSEACDIDISIALPGENDGQFKNLMSKIRLPFSAFETGFWIYADGDEPRVINCSALGGGK
jgi:serine/threonine protein kinase